MAFSKSHLFDPADQMTSNFARILAHPVRLDMLRKLSKIKSIDVESLTRHYPLSGSTLSQHLEMLREAGMVQFKEEYPRIIYSLDRNNFRKLLRYLLDYTKDF